MNVCKTNRRIKRRSLDERARYSAILHIWGLVGVRRTKRVLVYPAVGGITKNIDPLKISVVFLLHNAQVKIRNLSGKLEGEMKTTNKQK
jgi:hypothetical protein